MALYMWLVKTSLARVVDMLGEQQLTPVMVPQFNYVT